MNLTTMLFQIKSRCREWLGLMLLVALSACELNPQQPPDVADAGCDSGAGGCVPVVPPDAGVLDASPDSSDADCDGGCEDLDAGPPGVANGSSCTMDSECASGHCVDAVCCDTECATQCHACTAVLKGNGEDGACGAITPGNEPAGECSNGACTMYGVCSTPPIPNLCNTGADCASGFCVGGTCCAQSSCTPIDSCHWATCSSGTCMDVPRVCPGVGICVNGQCPNQCSGGIAFPAWPLIPLGISKGSGIGDVVMGDINGDGLSDIVWSTYGINGAQYQGSVGVSRNNGDGTFTPISAGGGGYEDVLGLADMNNDGALDIVEAAYQGSGAQNVSIYINQGQSGFTRIYSALGFVTEMNKVAIADLNNDGFRDIIVRENASGRLLAKLNNAGTTLGATIDTGISGDADFDAADMNGDGQADVVLTSSMTNTIELRLGNGNGTFGNVTMLSSVAGVNAVALRDIDGDGDYDLVASNGVDTQVRICAANGTLGAAVTYNGGGTDIVDINGDGFLDILGATTLFNNGNGTFSPQTMAYLPHEDAAFGDIDGDGLVDIAGVWSDAGIAFLLNQGNGAFSPPYLPYDLSFGNKDQFVSVDVNGDSREDWVMSTSIGTIAVFINMGNGNFAPRVDYPAGGSATKLAAADFDGDGLNDLVAASKLNVRLLHNLGAGTFGPPVIYSAKPMQGLGSATGDFNGDGYPDVARLEQQTPNAVLSVMFNQGNGTLGSRVEIATLMKTSQTIFDPEEIVAADFNEDGYSDIIVRGGPENNELFLSDGIGGFVLQGRVWPHWESFLVADYNGDGHPDIAGVFAESYPQFAANFMLNNGDGTFYSWKSISLLYSGGFLNPPVDVDKNGFNDAIVSRLGGTFSVYLNDGVKFGPEIRYATLGGAMVATDVNGDGVSELLSTQGALHKASCLP